jgi:transketolase
MRNAFADEILKLAREDQRIVLLMGDIGNRLFDKYRAEFPDRFYNCGIAEANMVSMAAGLAGSGFRPVCYTITPFLTYRVMEQIRLDVCYHHQPVILVGTGAGLSYASLGATHHSLEEMGMLRLLPDLVVACPGDEKELRGTLRTSFQQDHPVYIRIGKKGEPVIHDEIPKITFGKSLSLKQSTGKGAILAAGNLLPLAMEVAEQLKDVEVWSMVTIKPLDHSLLKRIFVEKEWVAVLEEHSILGGASGAISEWMSDQSREKVQARLIKCGTPDEFLHLAGEQEFAREHFGLVAEAVIERIQIKSK